MSSDALFEKNFLTEITISKFHSNKYSVKNKKAIFIEFLINFFNVDKEVTRRK